MSYDFRGRRALVTGAGKGIGRATAISLSQMGAKVFALSRTQADLDSLKASHPDIEILCINMADWKKTRDAVQSITPIHHLVNNAGYLKLTPVLDETEEQFNLLFDVNVKSVLNTSQVVVRDLMARGLKGTIVNVSSIAGFRGLPMLGTYCATKSAIDSFTKTMAQEWSKKGIRINAVNPTVILTAMGRQLMTDGGIGPNVLARTPQGKLGEVEDCVNAILFLLSEKSDMINGHSLPVEGGLLSG